MKYFFGYYTDFRGKQCAVKYATSDNLPIGGEFDVKVMVAIDYIIFETFPLEAFERYLPYETLLRLTRKVS